MESVTSKADDHESCKATDYRARRRPPAAPRARRCWIISPKYLPKFKKVIPNDYKMDAATRSCSMEEKGY